MGEDIKERYARLKRDWPGAVVAIFYTAFMVTIMFAFQVWTHGHP